VKHTGYKRRIRVSKENNFGTTESWSVKIAAKRKRKSEGKGTKRKQKKRHSRKGKSTLFVAHNVATKCVSKARKVSSALQVAN